MPTYAAEAQAQITQLTAQLERFGVGTNAQETIAGAFDVGTLTDFVLDLLASVAALSSSLLLVVTLLLFMAIDASTFPSLLAIAWRRHGDMADALTSFASGTRRYLLVSTVFGLIVAVIDTAIVWLAGIPAPLRDGSIIERQRSTA